MIGEIQFRGLADQGLHTLLQLMEDWPEAYPVAARHYMFGDRLYLRPLTFSPIVLFYNKRHVRECGLHEPDGSWTWADLIRAGERLSECQGRSGFAFHVPDINRWKVFLLQSGERFEWDDGRLRSLKGTGLMDSFRLLRNIFQNHKLFPRLLSE
jgi:multiple sugar transport system substrate-binding protein